MASDSVWFRYIVAKRKRLNSPEGLIPLRDKDMQWAVRHNNVEPTCSCMGNLCALQPSRLPGTSWKGWSGAWFVNSPQEVDCSVTQLTDSSLGDVVPIITYGLFSSKVKRPFSLVRAKLKVAESSQLSHPIDRQHGFKWLPYFPEARFWITGTKIHSVLVAHSFNISAIYCWS